MKYNDYTNLLQFVSGSCSFGRSSTVSVGGFAVTSVNYSTTACTWEKSNGYIRIRHSFKVSPVFGTYVGVSHSGWIQMSVDVHGFVTHQHSA